MIRRDCTWCGHQSHGGVCTQEIIIRRGNRTRLDETAPCPCAQRAVERWQDRAACLDTGLQIEFLARPEDEQLAICDSCPVRAECSQYGRQVGLSGVVYAGRRPREWPYPPADPEFTTKFWINGI